MFSMKILCQGWSYVSDKSRKNILFRFGWLGRMKIGGEISSLVFLSISSFLLLHHPPSRGPWEKKNEKEFYKKGRENERREGDSDFRSKKWRRKSRQEIKSDSLKEQQRGRREKERTHPFGFLMLSVCYKILLGALSILNHMPLSADTW